MAEGMGGVGWGDLGDYWICSWVGGLVLLAVHPHPNPPPKGEGILWLGDGVIWLGGVKWVWDYMVRGRHKMGKGLYSWGA